MVKNVATDAKEIVEYGFEGIIKISETSNRILQSIEIKRDDDI